MFENPLFLKTIHSIKNPIILLEGKRNVLSMDEEQLFHIGQFLAKSFPQATFRSGNADGSDAFFIQGVSSVLGSKIQIVTPYQGHKKKNIPQNAEVIALDSLIFDETSHFVTITKSLLSSYTNQLIDDYVLNLKQGCCKTTKAAYLLRDTLKVTGYEHFQSADFAFFYDDLNKPEQGGTGFTMQVCRTLKVPFLKQNQYFESQ